MGFGIHNPDHPLQVLKCTATFITCSDTTEKSQGLQFPYLWKWDHGPCLYHEGDQKPPSCLNQVVTHLQASSFDRLEHTAVRRVLLVNSVQEIHFDDVLWNGVLETVKHLAPITQCHILLVQLGSKQKHSCGEPQKTSLSQLTINGPNGIVCQGLVCQHLSELHKTFSLSPAQSNKGQLVCSYSLEWQEIGN